MCVRQTSVIRSMCLKLAPAIITGLATSPASPGARRTLKIVELGRTRRCNPYMPFCINGADTTPLRPSVLS